MYFGSIVNNVKLQQQQPSFTALRIRSQLWEHQMCLADTSLPSPQTEGKELGLYPGDAPASLELTLLSGHCVLLKDLPVLTEKLETRRKSCI